MQELLALTLGLPEIELAPGDVLLAEGDETGRLFVLVEGSLMVRMDGADFVAIDAPGACVGEMALLLQQNHSASVIAVNPSRLRVIDRAQEALRTNPEVLHAVATLLARRLDLVNRYLVDLQRQYSDVDGGLGMVGDMLKQLAGHHGQRVEPGSEREPDPLY